MNLQWVYHRSQDKSMIRSDPWYDAQVLYCPDKGLNLAAVDVNYRFEGGGPMLWGDQLMWVRQPHLVGLPLEDQKRALEVMVRMGVQ